VRYLVPDGLLDQAEQVLAIARHAFVRPLINGDAVRQRETVADAAVNQRSPLIQAQQAGTRRLFLHHNRHVAHSAPKTRRDRAKRFLHQPIELFGRHPLPSF
jgi:hypothetical protein